MRVQLIRAWPHRHARVEVELAADACVADALAASGWNLDHEFVAMSVFSVPATPETALHEGDRIELLRALRLDPMAARRRRAAKS